MTSNAFHPEQRVSLSRLARELGVDAATVQREAQRLEQAGILTSERVGRAKLVKANEDSPFFRELAGLILKAFRPVPILREKLRGLAGLEAAFIYGSWAARYAGEPGEQPGDLDLLVVGRPNRIELARLCRAATEQLGFEVSPTVVTKDDWLSGATGFIRAVKAEPLVSLIEGGDDPG